VLALSLAAANLALAGFASAQPSYAADRVARLIARGNVLREAGDTISALAYYRDAISAAPRKAEGYVALGELYLALDEPARALEVYTAGTRSGVHGEALWLGLAAALDKLGQHERALDALRRLRALDPGSQSGLAALADASEAHGSFVEALAARRALLALLADEPESDAQVALLADQNARVRALCYLLGAAERVRTKTICASAEQSQVRRALARCP